MDKMEGWKATIGDEVLIVGRVEHVTVRDGGAMYGVRIKKSIPNFTVDVAGSEISENITKGKERMKRLEEGKE